MAERLIDAEALEKEIGIFISIAQTYHENRAYKAVLHRIDVAPTIEAKPIVHAHWKECWDYNCDNYSYCCSNCGKDALTKEETMYDQVLTEFCPYCGAQMDEEFASDNNVGSKTPKGE